MHAHIQYVDTVLNAVQSLRRQSFEPSAAREQKHIFAVIQIIDSHVKSFAAVDMAPLNVAVYVELYTA